LKQKLVLIGGPTASGKNEIARELSLRIPIELVNADSRQIYRGLTIGTNQPSAAEMGEVPHHLFGFLEPSESFSASDYERLAAPLIGEVLDRGRLPVVVGGTGFYIKALLKGGWHVPAKDPALRRRFRGIAEKRGNQFLHRMLQRFDVPSAAQIAANDVYRVARALEIYFQSGKKRSELRTEKPDRFEARKYYVDIDRAELNANIEIRTAQMFEKGWVGEVRNLIEQYPGFEEMPAARSLGYPEVIRFLKGELDFDSCKETIVTKTRQYAKRQMTWFRNQDQFIRLNSHELHKVFDSVIQLTGEE